MEFAGFFFVRVGWSFSFDRWHFFVEVFHIHWSFTLSFGGALEVPSLNQSLFFIFQFF